MGKFFVAGSYRYGQCPSCRSQANTMVLDPNGTFTCMACGLTGTINHTKEAPEVRDTLRIIKLNETAAELFQKDLYGRYGKRALSYVRGRSLTDETIKAFRIGYAVDTPFVLKSLMNEGFKKDELVASGLFGLNENGTLWTRFKNRLMFPITNTKGQIIGFSGRVLDKTEPKYKNTPETSVYKKRENLFAFDKALASGKNHIIVCEGQMDVIAMHQAGLSNAVASLGTALTKSQARLIKSFTDRVILLYDTDEAGCKATKKAIDVLKREGIAVYVSNTAPHKDPDEFICNEGADALRQRLKNPMHSCEYLVRDAKDEKGNTNFLVVADVLLSEPSAKRVEKVIASVKRT